MHNGGRLLRALSLTTTPLQRDKAPAEKDPLLALMATDLTELPATAELELTTYPPPPRLRQTPLSTASTPAAAAPPPPSPPPLPRRQHPVRQRRRPNQSKSDGGAQKFKLRVTPISPPSTRSSIHASTSPPDKTCTPQSCDTLWRNYWY
ncbi:hypothetical protein QBC43DRAFT_291926 [Cladorrhinum sp. PSN259]|nr:hypothetical protein QBC43DRAFT_291926 [Cladorrhinum sp. PSN259]